MSGRPWPNVVTRITDKIKVDPDTGCWLWQGTVTRLGYAQIGVDKERRYVHRVVYILVVGEIPEGKELDHLCRVRHCVNPWHAEMVTHRENVLRGEGPTAINAAKTHCIHGHEFTEANTYREGTGRKCRVCRRDKQRRYVERKLAA